MILGIEGIAGIDLIIVDMHYVYKRTPDRCELDKSDSTETNHPRLMFRIKNVAAYEIEERNSTKIIRLRFVSRRKVYTALMDRIGMIGAINRPSGTVKILYAKICSSIATKRKLNAVIPAEIRRRIAKA